MPTPLGLKSSFSMPLAGIYYGTASLSVVEEILEKTRLVCLPLPISLGPLLSYAAKISACDTVTRLRFWRIHNIYCCYIHSPLLGDKVDNGIVL
jgi:hypothetical protein